MNKSINIILKVAVAVLAMVLTTSCIFEKEEIAGKKRDVMVLLDINTADMVATRAAEDEAEAEGDEAEDTTEMPTPEEEALNKVRVYAYDDSNDNLIGYADNSAANDGVFHMVLRVPEGLETIVADFYVVANEASMQNGESAITLHQNTSKQELMNLTFNALAGTALPMYGIEEDVTLYLNQGVQHLNEIKGHKPGFQLNQDINITLTRSLAKIEVYAAESAEDTGESDADITITGVSFANVPVESQLFSPLSDSEMTYQEGYISAVLKNEEGVVVGSKVKSADLNAIEVPDNYTPVSDAFYLAENNQGDAKGSCGTTDYAALTGDDATKATILRIAYTLGNDENDETIKYGYVKMPKIQRNTCYKVLARIKANGEIALTLNVLDWVRGNEVDVDFDNVVAHDESYGFKWFKGKTEVTNNVVNGTYTFSSAADDEVTCKFKLTAPIGGKWYATLTGGDIQKYSIVSGTGDIEGGEMSFKIKTLTNNFDGESANQVNLVITAVNTVGKSNVVDDFNYIIKQSQTN